MTCILKIKSQMPNHCICLDLPIRDRALVWQWRGSVDPILPLMPYALLVKACKPWVSLPSSAKWRDQTASPLRTFSKVAGKKAVTNIGTKYCPDSSCYFLNMIQGGSQQIEEAIYFCWWGRQYFFQARSNRRSVQATASLHVMGLACSLSPCHCSMPGRTLLKAIRKLLINL